MRLFDEMQRISRRPRPFEYYTSPQFWNDPHISKSMLDAHLDSSHDAASYRAEVIDQGVDWIATRLGTLRNKRICDFGCGPGLWTTRFAARGATVTGVDLSERSLRYARDVAAERKLTIHYALEDYFEYASDDRFDLITMIDGDFSVCSPEQREALLQMFRTQLAEGGQVLLEVSSMAYFHTAAEQIDYEAVPSGGFWSPGAHHLFTGNYKYEAERVLCDHYNVIDKDRELEVFIWVQCYSDKSLQELLEENGFQVLASYSDVAGTSRTDDDPRIAVLAASS